MQSASQYLLADVLIRLAPSPPNAQSNLSLYEDDQAVVAASKQYHDNASKRFFNARVKGHATWGVFNNEIGGH